MATVRVIHMPAHNRSVRLGTYVKGVQAVKDSPPGTEFKYGLTTWCSTSREEILDQFLEGVHDRINRHLKVVHGRGNASKRRLQRLLDRKAECKWCDQKTGRANRHFCSTDCARSYAS